MQKIAPFLRAFLLVAAAAFCASCASTRSVVSLNDPSRSEPGPNVASLQNEPVQLPYETMEKGGVAVSYNLASLEALKVPAYRLVLVVRNNTGASQIFDPKVSIRDDAGLAIPPFDFRALMTQAAQMAGDDPTASAESGEAYGSFSVDYGSGSARNGSVWSPYPYSGTAIAPPGGAYIGGASAGMGEGYANRPERMASRADDDRRSGQAMMKWAETYWVKGPYTLANASTASGALLFPAPSRPKLPFHLHVVVAGQSFEFQTRTQ